MIVVVGLGNPGEEYGSTRHNTGWMVVDKIIQKSKIKSQKYNSKAKSEIIEIDLKKNKVILVKPQTFMNSSGVAVKKIVKFPDCLWVIHDDIDLPLGQLKIVKNRGSAGHKGVESIIKSLKSKNFVRFRVGTGKNEVLGVPGGAEKIKFGEMIDKCAEAIMFALDQDVQKAMAKYNQK